MLGRRPALDQNDHSFYRGGTAKMLMKLCLILFALTWGGIVLVVSFRRK